MTSSFEAIAARFSKMHKATDEGWVWQAAKEHGCGVQHRTPFEQPSYGDYNLHTVAGYGGDIKQGTLNKLRDIKTAVLTCMDRRSVSQVASELSPDAFFATAGGPAQEYSPTRFNLDINFFAALVEWAPSLANIYFVSHSDTCGGLKVMTDGKSAEYKGDDEVFLMQTLTDNFSNSLKTRISRPVSLFTGVAIVESNKFKKIRWSQN